MNESVKRRFDLDCLRIFACFMVIIVHASTQWWYVEDPGSIQWKIYNLYNSAVRSSVPVFVMLSGELFLNKSELSIKRLFRKNIWKLLVVYCLWALFYGVDSLGLKEALKPENFFTLFQQIAYPKFHLWYLPTLIGIYIMIPIFWVAAKQKKNIYLEYACGMFFVFAIMRTTVLNVFESHETIKTILNVIPYELCGLSGYFITGYMLAEKKEYLVKIKTRYLLSLLAIIVIVTAKVEEYRAVSFGDLRGAYYANNVLPTFLEAAIIFVLFLKIPSDVADSKTKCIISRISEYTLFIYLIHVFILEHLNSWFGISTASFNALISVPAVSVLVFGISLVLAFLFEKIPIVGKWMI